MKNYEELVQLSSNKKLLGARTLLGAPGRTTRNKKLLGTQTLKASKINLPRHYDFVGQVFSRWAFCNPLHPELHPCLCRAWTENNISQGVQ